MRILIDRLVQNIRLDAHFTDRLEQNIEVDVHFTDRLERTIGSRCISLILALRLEQRSILVPPFWLFEYSENQVVSKIVCKTAYVS